MERLTIKCEELFVPKKICTTDRFGEVDDCDACDSVCDSDCKNCAIQECFTRLGEYEDTGLTPEQVMELKERDTAKEPTKVSDSEVRYTDDYICPNCGKHFIGTGIAEFCYHCGQRLKWED